VNGAPMRSAMAPAAGGQGSEPMKNIV